MSPCAECRAYLYETDAGGEEVPFVCDLARDGPVTELDIDLHFKGVVFPLADCIDWIEPNMSFSAHQISAPRGLLDSCDWCCASANIEASRWDDLPAQSREPAIVSKVLSELGWPSLA